MFGRRKKYKQCKAVFEHDRSHTYCTRERFHDGPHANALTQEAWVERMVDLPVTYRYPYEEMTVDTTLEVKGLQGPQYALWEPQVKTGS